MTSQLVDQAAARRLPEPADHVVADAGDHASIRRGHHAANPFRMGEDVAHTGSRLDVPPDQVAVVAA